MKEAGGGILNRDLVFGIVISSAVFLVAGTINIFGSIGAMLAPLPILYYYSKLGRLHGVIIFAASLAVVMIAFRLLHIQTVALSLLFLGSLGPILSELLRRNYSIEFTMLSAVGAFLLVGVIVLLYLSVHFSQTPLFLIESYVAGVVDDNIRMYSQLGGSPDQVGLLTDNAHGITRFLVGIFPAMVLVSTAILVWLNILLGKILFQRSGMWYPDFGDLSRWRLPYRYVWSIIVSGGLILLPLGGARILGVNILIVILFFYLLQGFSILHFFFNKKRIPIFLRAAGYFLIIAQQFLMLLVVVLGIIDVWVDFRKLEKKE